MTMRRADGFVHFNSGADWGAKGHSTGGSNYSFSATGGRGNRGMAVIATNAFLLETMPVQQVTTFHHFAVYTTARTNAMIASFRNSTNDNIILIVRSDGSIEVLRSSSTFGVIPFLITGYASLGVTVPNVFRNSTWHQLQVKCKIDSSTGIVEIYVDGVQQLSLTNQNTYCGAGGVYTTQVGMGTNGGLSDVRYSDFCVTDDQGSIYNGYLGDVACYEDVAPTDGAELQWIRSSGVGTWSSHVNQNPQDGDTTYISSAVSGDRNCFSFPTISSSLGTLLAIKETVCHRKEDASLGLIQLYSRSDDNIDHDGPTLACSQSYKFDERILEKDQKDNSTWTIAKGNATQLGIRNAS